MAPAGPQAAGPTRASGAPIPDPTRLAPYNPPRFSGLQGDGAAQSQPREEEGGDRRQVKQGQVKEHARLQHQPVSVKGNTVDGPVASQRGEGEQEG